MVWASVGVVSSLIILLFYLTIRFYFRFPAKEGVQTKTVLHCTESITQINQHCRSTKPNHFGADLEINERNESEFPQKVRHSDDQSIQTNQHMSKTTDLLGLEYSYGGYKRTVCSIQGGG